MSKAKETELKNRFEERLLELHDEESEQHTLGKNEFYVSQIGKTALELMFFKKYGRLKPTFESLKFFVVGDLVHEFLQKELFEGTERECEVPVEWSNGDLRLRGRADMVTSEGVYEFKTISTFGFRKLKDEPISHHVKQLNAYLNMMNESKGWLVYVNKENFDIRVFKVEKSPEMFMADLEFFMNVLQDLAENRCPEIPDKSSWVWKYGDLKRYVSEFGEDCGFFPENQKI